MLLLLLLPEPLPDPPGEGIDEVLMLLLLELLPDPSGEGVGEVLLPELLPEPTDDVVGEVVESSVDPELEPPLDAEVATYTTWHSFGRPKAPHPTKDAVAHSGLQTRALPAISRASKSAGVKTSSAESQAVHPSLADVEPVAAGAGEERVGMLKGTGVGPSVPVGMVNEGEGVVGGRVGGVPPSSTGAAVPEELPLSSVTGSSS